MGVPLLVCRSYDIASDLNAPLFLFRTLTQGYILTLAWDYVSSSLRRCVMFVVSGK